MGKHYRQWDVFNADELRLFFPNDGEDLFKNLEKKKVCKTLPDPCLDRHEGKCDLFAHAVSKFYALG